MTFIDNRVLSLVLLQLQASSIQTSRTDSYLVPFDLRYQQDRGYSPPLLPYIRLGRLRLLMFAPLPLPPPTAYRTIVSPPCAFRPVKAAHNNVLVCCLASEPTRPAKWYRQPFSQETTPTGAQSLQKHSPKRLGYPQLW